ncbi:hypothetical protein PILCRDRAFT_810317 [Piloderma croceum F 1598]|uniref:Uncharacterized protein n=1 Tax=Piloderma croceum (strain F 1598) TaxID=765440 RepID=A0A0C3GNX7_PILCF|nr:hypothetical protein PILCRDRAFT_810317 [Piloderma croceum F 1598]
MALRLAKHVSLIPRSPPARVGSSIYLSPQAGRIKLPSRGLRPISSLQISRMPVGFFRKSTLGTKFKWRQRCYSSDESAPMVDPNRPDLFYHLLAPPTPMSSSLPAFGLSFISKPPYSADSSVIIGWLPAASEGEGQEAGLNDFKENPKFRKILHEAIQSGLREDVDDIQRNGALQLQSGWMHINDERNIPALNRVGDPDDIIASVLVEDSKILAETYQAMPAYRICTVDGVTQLTEGLAKKLKELLEQAMSEEQVLSR